MTVTLRTASRGDIDAIAEINRRSWSAAYRKLMRADVIEAMSHQEHQSWVSERFGAGARGWALVAEDDGEPVGYIYTRPSDREGDDPRTDADLFALYVVPEAWGTSAGQKLHDEALSALFGNGFRRCTLWVVERNLRARRFYERNGWASDGARDFFHEVPLVRYCLDPIRPAR